MSIEIRDLHFNYGRVKALDGVTLDLGEGAVGLLGPNGAGKSTLLRILLGFLAPSRGEGKVLGYDIRRDQALIRRSVGYMPEDDCFIAGLDAVSFTSYFGELSGMPRQEAMKRAHEVLFYVGLGESRYRLLDTYSAGMKQRLKLAQALVHDPKLLFLDEPTTNLDPHGRTEILELIADIAADPGLQVLVSSHILSDIEALCASVVILNKGRVAAQGLLEDLRASDFSLYEIRIKGDAPAFRRRLEAAGCKTEETEDKLLRVFMPRGRQPFGTGNVMTSRPGSVDSREIFAAARETAVQIRHFVRSRTSLEDLFARAVGVD